MFEVIAHRGIWVEPSEKNSILAFNRAIDGGYGIETDFRDRQGLLWVAHDPNEDNPILAEAFFEKWTMSRNSTLAINVKADGLQDLLLELLQRYEITKYFIFDASIPDTLGYERRQMPFYLRNSELEARTPYWKKANGLWLDQFFSTWFDRAYILSMLEEVKSLCIVSPELHGRPYLPLWEMIRPIVAEISDSNDLLLQVCTDLPIQARNFFSGLLASKS